MHIGYKKCQDNRIVKLEITGQHNEDRKDIVDKNYAPMRCSQAKVIEIYDMHDKSVKYDEAMSFYKSLKYKVGEN